MKTRAIAIGIFAFALGALATPLIARQAPRTSDKISLTGLPFDPAESPVNRFMGTMAAEVVRHEVEIAALKSSQGRALSGAARCALHVPTQGGTDSVGYSNFAWAIDGDTCEVTAYRFVKSENDKHETTGWFVEKMRTLERADAAK